MKIPGEEPIVLADLDHVFFRAVRVVVKESPRSDAKVLFESMDQHDVDDLHKSLILEPPGDWFHCMCIGSPAVYLFESSGKDVQLTNHHGLSIRCSLWTSDVRVSDTEKWLSWFDHRGISGPRQEVESRRAQEAASARDSGTWLAAMPKAIAPLWASALGQFGDVDVAPLRAALERELPEEQERILALLKWFGSGAGPWSGFPSYESAAEELLLQYSTASIVKTIQSLRTSPAQTEGAARLFGGWSFRQQRPAGLRDVPDVLKRELWDHVKETDDKDKLARAESAFTQSGA